jgi:AcrR family transcriptional regulator
MKGVIMAPKILNEQNRIAQREKLLAKGRELLNAFGIRKTSIEDITRAAGMAKGSFYLYFKSKEELFLEIINRFHKEWFMVAEKLVQDTPVEMIREKIKGFIIKMFNSPDYLSVFKYHDEMMELIKYAAVNEPGSLQDLLVLEHETYAHLLRLCGKDLEKVKPGVVHNYVHLLYVAVADKDIMVEAYKSETFSAALEGLLNYIFGE